MSKFILSIDQGTSGTKVLLFDNRGRYVHRVSVPHKQFYPHPGWVEHDAMEIFNNTVAAIDSVIKESHINEADISAASISNQRETVVAWDKSTGLPVSNSIVWQDNRATEICNEILEQDFGDTIMKKTGLVLSPYYSAAKMKWILDSVPGAREKAENGSLLFGTIDSWLIYKFTGGQVHATEYSNASRTQLLNISELTWDEELLKIFTIPRACLPEIYSSNHIFGEIAVSSLSNKSIPIAGVLGDSHAALFGQNCFERGMAKVTYGTGSSIMMNIGKSPYESKKGLVTSIGWVIGNSVEYVAEGNINCSGATIKWLVDDLQLIEDSKSTEEIASSINDNEGVYMVPAFVGLGTPYWDSDSTALITGMTRGTKKAHIVRAVLESMGYQVKDILDIMTGEANVTLKEIRVDGGPTRNSFIMQFQSDMLQVNVVVNQVEEICALGAAYMAGLAIGLWKNKDELKGLRTNDVIFKPNMSVKKRDDLYQGWKKAIARTLIKL
ncbi:MAG: glycerol kinase GlpK [Bacillota bacterium]|nr:glycerol kinase GlpK [Bacillota bacterium]